MNPRGKIVAVQAAAVAALVVVVYVTLLRPEGPSTITGIEAPDGRAIPRIEAHERPGKRPGKPPHPAEQGGRHRPSSRGTPPAAFVAAGVTAATGVAPPGGSAVSPQTPPGDVLPPGGSAVSRQTPPGDQYTDAVKALLDRVSAARVPGQ